MEGRDIKDEVEKGLEEQDRRRHAVRESIMETMRRPFNPDTDFIAQIPSVGEGKGNDSVCRRCGYTWTVKGDGCLRCAIAGAASIKELVDDKMTGDLEKDEKTLDDMCKTTALMLYEGAWRPPVYSSYFGRTTGYEAFSKILGKYMYLSERKDQIQCRREMNRRPVTWNPDYVPK